NEALTTLKIEVKETTVEHGKLPSPQITVESGEVTFSIIQMQITEDKFIVPGYGVIESTARAIPTLFNRRDPFMIPVSMAKSCTEALRASVHHLTLNIYKTSNVYFTTQTTTLT
ncbi:hypothetical protein TVAG_497840, partial [Trichomonas vaginalis G3]